MSDTIVDSCCILNLFAGGDLLSLLPPLGVSLQVPEIVLRESLFIRQPDPEDATLMVPQAVDLEPALQAGVLCRCDIDGEAELGLFVELATILDDGEAVCLAIAQSRGWTLATDDRKARREAVERGVQVVTTPELVKAWSEATEADVTAVAAVLRNIQAGARFLPHKTMPLHDWWMGTLGGHSKQ